MKYIKNLILFYLAFVINFILNFALIKILTNFLDQDTLGKFFFVSNLGLFVGGILLLGFPLIFQRYIPVYLRDNNRAKAMTLIHLPAIIHFASGLFLSIPLFILKGSTNAIIFFSFFVANTITLYQTALISEARILEYFLTTSPRLLLITIIIFIIRQSLNLSSLAFINLTFNTAFLLINFTLFPLILTDWKEVVRDIKDYWKFSFLTQVLSPFFFYIDSVLIPLLLPFRDLATFQISRKLDMGARQTLEVPLQLTAPLISFKKTDELLTQDFAMKYRAFRTFYFYLALLWFLIFQFGGKFIITLISSSQYLNAYPYLLILSFTLLISSIYAPDAMLARATGNIKLFFLKDLVFIAAFLISYFPLTWKLKLPGVAISFLTAACATAFFHIRSFKVLHDLEYLFDAIKILVLGIQALNFALSGRFWVSILTILTLLIIDFKNLKNALIIILASLRRKGT